MNFGWIDQLKAILFSPFEAKVQTNHIMYSAVDNMNLNVAISLTKSNHK